MSRLVINDVMWKKLEGMLPQPKGRHGKDDRLFLEAVCWVIRTDAHGGIYLLIMGTGKTYTIAIITGLKKKTSIEYLKF